LRRGTPEPTAFFLAASWINGDRSVKNAHLSLLLMLSLAPAAIASAQDDDEESQDGAASGLQQPSDQSQQTGTEQTTEQATEQAPQQTPTPTPTATEEEEEAAEAAHPDAQLPWRNTYFSATVGVNFNSFLRGAQPTYNPTVNTYLYLTPRWYIDAQTFLASTFWAYYEFTDTNGGALNHDFQLLDPNIEIRRLIPFEGFVFMPSARITLPASKSSQALQRYFNTGLGLTITRPIEEINFTIATSFRYTRWWAGSNVARGGGPQMNDCENGFIRAGAPGDYAPSPSFTNCDQLGDVTGGRDIVLAGLTLTWTPFAGLSIYGQYFFYAVYGFELGPSTYTVDTSPTPITMADQSPTHWRDYSYFTLAVGYDIMPWFNLAIGIQNTSFFSGFWNANGTVRNPVFTPDTQVYLSATFQLDAIYGEIAGVNETALTPEQRQRRRQGLAAGPRRGGSF